MKHSEKWITHFMANLKEQRINWHHKASNYKRKK